MNSKERVLSAFKKKRGLPDRVPVQFDLCKQLIDSFGRELGIVPDYALSYYEDLTYRISANEIRTKLGSDVVVVGGTVPKNYQPEVIQGNITKNEFGMHMKPTPLYVEVVKCPLGEVESAEEVEKYAFPNPDAPGRFDTAKRDIDRFRKDFFVIGDVEITLFELAWHLTGLEKYLTAMMMEEPWVEKLNDRVEQWSLRIALQLVKAGVDAIWLGEDLGSQTSTLISPDDWRRMFKWRHKRMIDKLKQENANLIVIMHSDGAVAPLIDDFIEIGVDVYNPVQPNVPGSDPAELKAKYGDKICFFGGIDQQNLLPGGNIKQIRTEINYRTEILGKNGGYLLAPAHIIQADVNTTMVKEMIRAAREFGRY
ncbi:MAG: uroporphyrinogen decarboxylase family protein [Prolixibacteraceae bacterium]|jgi:uroporphyrinogen decarboxylase|nr:uroporphyrinogen decarboxylase family protein [Prolixibacteraceae bacterium]